MKTNFIEIELDHTYCGLLPTFIIKGNAKSYLEVNEDVVFFPHSNLQAPLFYL